MPDTAAALLLDRGPGADRRAVAVPAQTRESGGRPVRRPLALWIDGAVDATEDTIRLVARALPQLDADPGFRALFDHAPASPSLTVSTEAAPGGHRVTLDPDAAGPQPARTYSVAAER